MKYKLTEETREVGGFTLHRIEALKDFSDVKKGEKGGWVEKEDNLSQLGNCWVYDNACVFANAKVYRNAKVCGNAKVYDKAFVFGNAKVFGNACVHGNTGVFDNAKVCGDAVLSVDGNIHGDAEICSNADYIVFKNWWSSGRYFIWTRSNNMWSVGCFYGTGEELIAKAYKDSELSGREYKRVVDYVKSILIDEKGGNI